MAINRWNPLRQRRQLPNPFLFFARRTDCNVSAPLPGIVAYPIKNAS